MTKREIEELLEELRSPRITTDRAVTIAFLMSKEVDRCMGLAESLRNSLETLQGEKRG